MALPVCLGPLRLCERFVLVGDQYQLPPLFGQARATKEPEASLFQYLSQIHPESIVSLTEQYRMNDDIMSLTNHLVYDGRLKCGSAEVAKRRLDLPTRDQWFQESHSSIIACDGISCWQSQFMDPE